MSAMMLMTTLGLWSGSFSLGMSTCTGRTCHTCANEPADQKGCGPCILSECSSTRGLTFPLDVLLLNLGRTCSNAAHFRSRHGCERLRLLIHAVPTAGSRGSLGSTPFLVLERRWAALIFVRHGPPAREFGADTLARSKCTPTPKGRLRATWAQASRVVNANEPRQDFQCILSHI